METVSDFSSRNHRHPHCQILAKQMLMWRVSSTPPLHLSLRPSTEKAPEKKLLREAEPEE